MKILLPLLTLLILACTPSTNKEITEEELANWDDWKSKRMENLVSPDGFLNLAGLFWLKQGDNTIGSGSTNSIQFPEDLPDFIGNLQLKGNVVSLLEPTTGLKIDSLAATQTTVFNQDSSITKLMEYDSFRWYIIERGGDIGIRLKDLNHPMLSKTIDIEYFDYNPEFAINADFIPYSVPKILKVTNVLGHEFEMNISGQLSFEIDGETYTLEPLDAGDEFFIIFSDGTSAIETYGSGRYLYAKKGEPGETIDLNFNKAYNPPCAFTDFATCLIPPRENQLDIRISAGEYNYHLEALD
jgi:uncharacterized protein (DUF1684 family)